MVYYPAMAYTVKQLATLARITKRTLHYYDEIGLLRPDSTGTNGYRYYDEAAILRLQQILFYRELELPLERICNILDQPDFNLLVALEGHRIALKEKEQRIASLLKTVDDTIRHLKGEINMDGKQLFEAFSDEQQEAYAREAAQLYDPKIVRESNRKWKSYTEKEKKRIGEEGNAAYELLRASIDKGAGSSEAQLGVSLWRKQMEYFWSPDADQLVALAKMYCVDARFKANFEQIDPRLAEFIGEAVAIYVDRLKNSPGGER